MTADLSARLRAWRHHLHRHPETAFAEHATADYLAGELEALGFDVARGLGGTGLVASLTRGTGDRAVGLRTDLDGLPITEVPGREHGSVNRGAMHACGHDGHMAMALGAAAVLAEEGGFDGTVRIVGQPAEEPGRGAQAMLDDGLLERFPLDVLYGLHNLPGLPAGHLHVRPGGIMASEDNFTIVVHGRGGHAARPEAVVDPLVAGAEIVLALQTVVARNVDPVRPAVVSCTGFETDGARNAIPSTVRITGDTRSFDPQVQELLERRIREIATGVAAAHGATAEVTYTHEFAPTVNDPEVTARAVAAATAALGADRVVGDCDPILPSEDFGVFARHVPACFALLGNGTEPGRGGTPLHSADYDLNDEILPAGVAFYVAAVRAELPAG
ncbi:M20 aminoacylase family protein [Ornithinimicrobium humiphilum]|uniref:Hippurate hydrolase n=1 Tax=Ornithinimicrobium humiphilum TaxID=125288 RepID=A0A543K877_9MICO|nr:amidohydrolase [Ornithinimicrobium humiphilum]TQM91244.1 hippurate hydrolase [Ornithinimicrobium humiphilum]